MRGFRDPKRTQRFLSCFGPVRQHFALKRHLLRASLYRQRLVARFVAWRELTEVTRIRPTGSEGRCLLPSFRLSLDKLAEASQSSTVSDDSAFCLTTTLHRISRSSSRV